MHLKSFLTILSIFCFFTSVSFAQEEDLEQALVKARAAEIEARDARKRAEKALKKADTPAMKKARKEIEHEVEEEKELKEENSKVLANAAITGCEYAEPVIVNARAIQFSKMTVMASVRIINRSSVAQDIETATRGIGVAVKNLCPGGAITLAFARTWVTDSETEEIVLMAIGRNQGSGTQSQTFSLYLNRSDVSYRRVQSRVWEIYGR